MSNKYNNANIRSMARLLALVALLGQGYAQKEVRRVNEARRHGYHPTKGAFGGPRRAGAKLLRRMAKAGLKAPNKATGSKGKTNQRRTIP